MDNNQIKAFVEANPCLVRRKPTVYDGVYLLKYHNRVFYKNLWTPELLLMRGTMVDEDYNIVSRPFTKVYNYGENATKINRDELCTKVRKINGFMGQMTMYGDTIVLGTTGSTESDFADMVLQHLAGLNQEALIRWGTGYTLLFEICDPSDPHIVHEEHGVYLIGRQANMWGDIPAPQWLLDKAAGELGALRTEWEADVRFSDIVKEAKTVQHEGFMVYGQESEKVLKLKSSFYLTTKFLGRMRVDKLLDLLENPDRLKRSMDEEFYGVIDFLNETQVQWIGMENEERIRYIRAYFEREFK